MCKHFQCKCTIKNGFQKNKVSSSTVCMQRPQQWIPGGDPCNKWHTDKFPEHEPIYNRCRVFSGAISNLIPVHQVAPELQVRPECPHGNACTHSWRQNGGAVGPAGSQALGQCVSSSNRWRPDASDENRDIIDSFSPSNEFSQRCGEHVGRCVNMELQSQCVSASAEQRPGALINRGTEHESPPPPPYRGTAARVRTCDSVTDPHELRSCGRAGSPDAHVCSRARGHGARAHVSSQARGHGARAREEWDGTTASQFSYTMCRAASDVSASSKPTCTVPTGSAHNGADDVNTHSQPSRKVCYAMGGMQPQPVGTTHHKTRLQTAIFKETTHVRQGDFHTCRGPCSCDFEGGNMLSAKQRCYQRGVSSSETAGFLLEIFPGEKEGGGACGPFWTCAV